MADIETLGAHMEPPEDQEWVKLDRGASGGYFVHTSLASDKGFTLTTTEPLVSKAAAMELAQELASQHDIAVIHIKAI
ncbi:MAG TPA: hypothetical protein VHY79_09540 [Rhizomicrobium sp.]|jgi:hypothetical protein|nr:hypothetical protein [Rhizomicrobium sp.]